MYTQLQSCRDDDKKTVKLRDMKLFEQKYAKQYDSTCKI